MSNDPLLRAIADSWQRLAPSRSTVLVAVSGGADSVALFSALILLREDLGITRLGVAHVNHGLRGEESDGDEAFVRRMAEREGVRTHVAHLTGRELVDAGIEAWAREERYGFFLDVKTREGYDVVATAHTADDQAETLIMRLWRGTGLRGLAGIREIRDDGVVRPMLGVTRSGIEAWLASRGLTFRHDSSNDLLNYQRNHIRHRIMPLLRALEPQIVDIIGTCADNFRDAAQILSPALDSWVSANVINELYDAITVRKDGQRLTVLASHALIGMLEDHGCHLTRDHVAAILSCADRHSGTILLPNGWQCVVRGENIVMGASSSTSLETAPRFRVDLPVPGVATHAGHDIVAEIVEIREERPPFDPDNRSVVLDVETIGGSLCYRSLDQTEVFLPLGASEPRAVGKYLKSQGIAHEERSSMGCVALESGAIVWIPGVQIGHAYRLTSHSTRAVRLVFRSRRTV